MRATGKMKKLGLWLYFIWCGNCDNRAVFINVLFSGMIHDLLFLTAEVFKGGRQGSLGFAVGTLLDFFF